MNCYLIDRDSVGHPMDRAKLESALALGAGKDCILLQGVEVPFTVETQPRVTIGATPAVAAKEARVRVPSEPDAGALARVRLVLSQHPPLSALAITGQSGEPAAEVIKALAWMQHKGEASCTGRGKGARWSKVPQDKAGGA